ncbi:energy coupling factor transporter S component ThiW [Lacicoccus alkaliphilus]|uniref:Energy coupling factor transporter S component ThiW n=1 Tax=Lacicoccus alkaliphilus DSM 16010 TaxID=1123231 RepID=A0A1M7C0Z8_9BACL|nr:energy coupling factor transporter S component ThiW [Salinicoccus alkaliphilus]SHL60874.1 energy coupling factor transporter S component ThiW [Salinicoccus alkaliphilus DSM 16010]
MTRKLTMTSILIALNVVLGMIVTIPLGFIRAAPVQHLINVIGAVLTGPWVVLQAFVSSTIRILLGTGTPFAYPGSMAGALLAWLLYRRLKKLPAAVAGEVIGTGLIGALMTYPLILVLGLDGSFFMVLAPAFIASSLIGALISWFILRQLEKRNVLARMMDER